jgi:hypothetical protein
MKITHLLQIIDGCISNIRLNTQSARGLRNDQFSPKAPLFRRRFDAARWEEQMEEDAGRAANIPWLE